MVVGVPLLYALLPLTVPIVGCVTISWTLRLLRFLGLSYITGTVALKDLRERHDNLFFNLKCFFAVFGFSLVMFLIFLYFYTSAFPVIVSFARTPLFWFGKVILLARLLNKFIVYKEIKKLDSSITVREYLFASGPLVLFSGKVAPFGANTLLTTPTQFGVADYGERSVLMSRSRSLADRHGNMVAELSNISSRSRDIKRMKVYFEAVNTHFGVAIHYPGSKYMFTCGATSDGSKVSEIFPYYDAHLRKIFEGKTEFVNINNRILAGFSEKGQSIVTNAIQLREFVGGNVVRINALDYEMLSLLNFDLFGKELSGLMGCIESRNKAIFTEINSSTSEEQLLAILSRINRSGFTNIVDLRMVAGKLPNCISILTGLPL